VLFGQLGADPEPKSFYRELERDPAFQRPVAWADIDVASFDGMLLPGGHAPGMRQYLDGEELRRRVIAFWSTGRLVGAICHGVIVLARAVDPETGSSVLRGRRTTCLPAYMERTAYALTAWKLGRYYRTYPAYVEHEVRAALAAPAQFERGPISLVARGSATDDRAAFVVDDGRYLSARWPGDAYLFGRRFTEKLEQQETRPAGGESR
jgi:putative intracellular protease/amidase